MRKKFLIKPGLQIRQLLWTLSVVLVSCLVAYFLFEAMISSALMKNGMSYTQWFHVRGILRWGFTIVLLILLAAIGVENYLLFHQFVGPIYALEKGLRKIASGDLDAVTKIRDSDQLTDLVNAFEDMKKEIRVRLSAQEKVSHVLTKELDKILASATQNNVHELREQLIEIRKQLEKRAA